MHLNQSVQTTSDTPTNQIAKISTNQIALDTNSFEYDGFSPTNQTNQAI
jgi:hypothetical protein